MPRWVWFIVWVSAGLMQVGCGRVPASDPGRSPVNDSSGVFAYSRPIDTPLPRVQRLFDRGMAHAFGHEWGEATRLLRKAVRLDSSCAPCYWGLAYAAGATDNASSPETLHYLARAGQLAVSTRDRALIAATGDSLAASSALRLAHLHSPDDPDVAVVYVESLLRAASWVSWKTDGSPGPTTVESLRVLEAVLERHPGHPGAQHLYLHILEPSLPELALGVAERLAAHPSPVRHLRYLPARIFLRAGRYHDASRVLDDVLDAGPETSRDCAFAAADGSAWPYGELLWSALVYEGRGADAREVARRLARNAAQDSSLSATDTRRQYLRALPLLTLARFGDWERVERQPEPSPAWHAERSIWQFIQGLAAARRGDRERLLASQEHLQAVRADSVEALALSALPIMEAVIAGELATLDGLTDDALRYMNRAVILQDSLERGSMSPLFYSARHRLGDALLVAGRPEEAERVFEEDLAIHPENGRALWGLYRSLKAQNRETAARIVLDRFNRAWEWADVTPQGV